MTTQYAVCHIERGAGNDSGMSCHIERRTAEGKEYIPDNADGSRTQEENRQESGSGSKDSIDRLP